ncbi:MAG: hypothetical protein ACKOYM_05155, partial [Actinomycetes bacterium]
MFLLPLTGVLVHATSAAGPAAAVNPETVCVNRGWACPWIYEQTGSEPVARAAGWLLEKPLLIALILVACWLLN